MNCYVCGTNLDEGADCCPCCGEYVVETIGDPAETERILKEKGEKRRTKLLSQYGIEIAVYKWEEEQSRKMRVQMPPAESLYRSEGWLEEPFARVPGMEEFAVETAIRKAGEEKTVVMTVQSFSSPTFLHIGAVIEDGFQLRLVLKNDDGEIHRSEAVSLLDVL